MKTKLALAVLCATLSTSSDSLAEDPPVGPPHVSIDFECNQYAEIELLGPGSFAVRVCDVDSSTEAAQEAISIVAALLLPLVSCPTEDCDPAAWLDWACIPDWDNAQASVEAEAVSASCYSVTIHSGLVDIGCTLCPPF